MRDLYEGKSFHKQYDYTIREENWYKAIWDLVIVVMSVYTSVVIGFKVSFVDNWVYSYSEIVM